VPSDYSAIRNKFLSNDPVNVADLVAVDATSYVPITILQHTKYHLIDARFSPDENWIVLMAGMVNSLSSRIFIAPYREDGPPDEKEFIAITDESAMNRNACWSPDGGMIYFTSDRDGYCCLWAQRVNIKSKKPVGDPMAIYHFHRAGLLMPRFGPEPLGIAVAHDKIVFNLRESTGNIWMIPYP